MSEVGLQRPRIMPSVRQSETARMPLRGNAQRRSSARSAPDVQIDLPDVRKCVRYIPTACKTLRRSGLPLNTSQRTGRERFASTLSARWHNPRLRRHLGHILIQFGISPASRPPNRSCEYPMEALAHPNVFTVTHGIVVDAALAFFTHPSDRKRWLLIVGIVASPQSQELAGRGCPSRSS